MGVSGFVQIVLEAKAGIEPNPSAIEAHTLALGVLQVCTYAYLNGCLRIHTDCFGGHVVKCLPQEWGHKGCFQVESYQ